jgi:drug/metabolite transporter (DMT)-like permease
MLAVAVILWGSAPPGIRAALKGYSPAHLALLRFGGASVLLAAYGLLKGSVADQESKGVPHPSASAEGGFRLPARRDLPGLILTGAVGIAFYNTILNYGLVTTPAGTASFLIASTPIWTALLAIFTLGERLNAWGWTGILISFFGIGLLARERGHGLHFSQGALLILVGAISYGLYMVLQKRMLGRYPALAFTTYSFWAGSLLMLVFAPGAVAEVRAAPLSATLSLLYLAVFPAAVANFAWAYAMSHAPASRVSSFLYLMPLVSVALAWVWLGEVPTLLSLVGGLLALAGVALVNWKGHVKEPAPSPLPEIAD